MKSTTQAADGLINEMEQDSNAATIALSTPRRKSMFFEKVGSPKEIPFKTTLFLYKKLNGEDYFTTGTLVSKTQTAEGFQYLFSDDQQRELVDAQEFSYWLLPVRP